MYYAEYKINGTQVLRELHLKRNYTLHTAKLSPM